MRTRRVVSVVGCHAAGEIGDVIVGGVLPPPGATMFEKMQAMQRDFDHVRTMLLLEPRGSVARHVSLVTPPTRADCVAGAIIMEPTEYPPMSGSNTMCVATVLLETGVVPMREPETVLNLDMPGGVVQVRAACRDGVVESVELQSVPAFVDQLDATLDVKGLGNVQADVAYGGMFYAIVNAEALGFALEPKEARDISAMGEAIRVAAREQLNVVHPANRSIRGVSIVQFAGPFQGAGTVARSAVVVSPGRLDRSPTGTALCARMAVLRARGRMRVGDTLIQESVLGTRFEGRIVSATTVAGCPAIVPSVKGSAYVTGFHQYYVDPRDPFPEGYVLSDTWGITGKAAQ